jgi:predicted DNA-binding ArsR family transcriptional regulator
MISAKVHVNDQFKMYQKLHNKRYWYTQTEVEDMIARDSCRKGDIYITKCMMSKNWRDPFILVMSNAGEVNLVLWEKDYLVNFNFLSKLLTPFLEQKFE